MDRVLRCYCLPVLEKQKIMTIESIPDALINDIQDIYWDPENDEKPVAVKAAIVKHLTDAGITVVRKEDLESWLSAIKESRQFKEQAETDIGWVAETIDRIQRVAAANPIKILSKVMMGGQDKLKELGLDPANLERLEQIAAKYAPLTYARLKSQPQIK